MYKYVFKNTLHLKNTCPLFNWCFQRNGRGTQGSQPEQATEPAQALHLAFGLKPGPVQSDRAASEDLRTETGTSKNCLHLRAHHSFEWIEDHPQFSFHPTAPALTW